MRQFSPVKFSFSPLLAVMPGLVVFLIIRMGGQVTNLEAGFCALMIIAGCLWQGAQGRQMPIVPKPSPKTQGQDDDVFVKSVIGSFPDPVLLLDNRRQVVVANRAAHDLLGDGLYGRDVCLILRQPQAQQAVKDVIEGVSASADMEMVFVSPVRRIYYMQIRTIQEIAPLFIRAVVVLHEITALKSADDMRANFVANVSHELRSPLATLIGFIETLQTSAKGDSHAQDRFLRIMDREAGRMTVLIDDLLSLSRIEGNEHIRPNDAVTMATITEDVAQSVELKLAEKDMRLDIRIPSDLSEVPGDSIELRQVMQNLIDNAITYGARSTPIVITARNMKSPNEDQIKGIELAVQNAGDGIDGEHLPRLTERFYRVDKGRSRAMGGTGLGLAIVKHIINRHRGQILVHSELGKGSIFTVQLPCNPIKKN